MKTHHCISVCPACMKRFDAATNVGAGEESPPKVGDFTVCIDCGTPLRFSKGLALRRVTADEITALPMETRLALALARTVVTTCTKEKAP